MFLAHNFRIIKEKDFTLEITNRGFLYGDGLFETMILKNGKIRFLATHFQRLKNGLETLGMNISDNLSISNIEKTVNELLTINNISLESAKIKIHAWRKSGGLYNPTSNEFDFIITVFPFEFLPIIERSNVSFYTEAFISYSPISKFKSLNASIYTLGGIFMKKNELDDVIFLNENQNIVECLYTNIWWIKDNELFTPSLKSGCVGGVMQHQIFSSKKCKTGLYQKNQLLAADAVFTSNVTGITPIKKIDNQLFNTQHELIIELQNEFNL